MQHLYVMQNHLGLVKIGRSVRVEQRRRTLEKADECEIRVVAVFENEGDREESIHIELEDQRLIGEWFDGDKKALKSIIKALGLTSDIVWPYPLADNDTICDWLNLVEKKRAIISADKQFQRCIREMAAMPDGDPHDHIRFHDGKIWSVLWRFEHCENTIYMVSEGNSGDIVLQGYREGYTEPEIIPLYTTSTEAALQLWPEQDRPDRWEGTAWTCCIAALQARKARINAKRPGEKGRSPSFDRQTE